MKKIYWAAVLMTIAATFTACSYDETIEQKQIPAIGFNPLVNRPTITRGLSITNASDVKSFDVWAYSKASTNDEALYMGYAKDGVKINSGFTGERLGDFTVSNVTWGYNDLGEVAYWPASDKLQFVALSPAHDYTDGEGTEDANKTNVSYTFTDDALDFAKTTQMGFTYTADNTVPESNINTQLRDIAVAANYQSYDTQGFSGGHGDVASPARGNVPFIFRHLLSKIELQGQINRLNKNIIVEIKKITIHNIIKKGSCKLNLADIGEDAAQNNFAATNPFEWTPLPDETTDDNANYANYVITPMDATDATLPVTLKYDDEVIAAANTPEANSTAVSLLNTGDNLFMIPQEINEWDHDAAAEADRKISKADTDKKVYLEIEAKIKQKGIYLVGSADSYGKTYAPLPTPGNAWEPEKKYVYTLIFGVGEDQDGNSHGSPITFSVTSVSNWSQESREISM